MNLENIVTRIDTWLQASQDNYVTYMITLFGIIIVSFIVAALVYRKIGGKDERTVQIKLHISHITFAVGFIATFLIMTSISTGTVYISQLGLLPLAITVVTGALTSLIFYLKNR